MALVIFLPPLPSLPLQKYIEAKKHIKIFNNLCLRRAVTSVLSASTDFWFLSSCGPSRFEACRASLHTSPHRPIRPPLAPPHPLLQAAMQQAPATTRAHGVIIVPEHGDRCELVAAHMDVSKRARLHVIANCDVLATRSF